MIKMPKKKTNKQFISELAVANPTVEAVGEYIGAREKITCRCRVCGHTWEATPTNLLKGRKCPRCRKTGTSFMEQYIYYALASVLGDERVMQRDKSAIGMELDIYVFPSLAIEIGSWNWHKDKAYGRDKEKQKRCMEKGIELIVIYDSVPENAIAPEGCITYPFDLAGEENQKSLQLLTKDLIAYACDGLFEDSVAWQEIGRKALLATGARGHNRFIEEMSEIDSSILIRGEYVNDRTKVSCECKTCGHQWEATANSLLQKHGCPRCSAKRTADLQRKKPDIFLKEIAQVNPGVEVIGKYKGTDSKIACRCRKCGHEWNPWASALRRKHGCPKCGAASSIAKRRKTHEQFVAELARINQRIEVEGSYINATTKIQCLCKECGCRWMVVPDSLLQGTGCPRCGQKNTHDALRKTHEEFVGELALINPTVKISGTYAGARAEISCICRVCGHEWVSRPSRLLGGGGCPKCGKRRAADSRRKTHEQFLDDLRRVNSSIEIEDRYSGSKKKVSCRCKMCGNRWQAQAGYLLSGKGCPNCKVQ